MEGNSLRGQSCLLLVSQGDDEVLAGISAALEVGHGRSGEHIYRGMEGLSGRETCGHRPACESVEQESSRDERNGLVVARNDDGAILVMGARWPERAHTHFDEVGKCRAQIQWEPDENERYSVGVSE